MRICDKGKCTACNACINICPAGCIAFETDELEMTSAVIDEKKCIRCGRCQEVCPQIKSTAMTYPQNCYAAWSKDEDVRFFSASGGIAAELCLSFVKNGGLYAGVRLEDNFKAKFVLTNSLELLEEVQNSKYVYSDTGYIYRKVEKELKNGTGIVFIGLPCQIDGLKQYLLTKKTDMSKLLLVDLICHGVMSFEFLHQHIDYIEKKYGKKADRLFFRDPYTYTYTFSLSLYNNKRPFYRRRVSRNDAYQIAYHYGIAYRENCYSCRYARAERVGDLTLADFSYVGKEAPCAYDNKNVSCVLVNTEKGRKYFEELVASDKIFAEERPLQEELLYESQLSHPTKKGKEHELFVNNYIRTKNFEKSMRYAAGAIIKKNEIQYYLHVKQFKHLMGRLLPASLKEKIRNNIRK